MFEALKKMHTQKKNSGKGGKKPPKQKQQKQTEFGEKLENAQKTAQKQQAPKQQAPKQQSRKKKSSSKGKSSLEKAFTNNYRGKVDGVDLSKRYLGTIVDVRRKNGHFDRATVIFVGDDKNIHRAELHRLACPANMEIPEGSMPSIEFGLNQTEGKGVLTAVNVTPKAVQSETGEVIENLKEGLSTLVSYSVEEMAKASFAISGENAQDIADQLSQELDVMGLDEHGNFLVLFEE